MPTKMPSLLASSRLQRMASTFRRAHGGGIEHWIAVFILRLFSGYRFEILRHALRLEMADYLFHLFVGHERPVHTADAAAAGHVEHVTLAQELFGALLAQNRAAVDLRGDLERDAGRKICLDRAGDDVDRRPLRRQDDMQTGGTRHLRDARDRARGARGRPASARPRSQGNLPPVASGLARSSTGT